jgi:hypothetical protein
MGFKRTPVAGSNGEARQPSRSLVLTVVGGASVTVGLVMVAMALVRGFRYGEQPVYQMCWGLFGLVAGRLIYQAAYDRGWQRRVGLLFFVAVVYVVAIQGFAWIGAANLPAGPSLSSPDFGPYHEQLSRQTAHRMITVGLIAAVLGIIGNLFSRAGRDG